MNGNGSLESMLGVSIVIAFLVFGKFLLISFAGPGSLFLSLMIILLVSSLIVMFSIMYLSKLKEIETSVVWGRFLDATIFVVFASLFGFLPPTECVLLPEFEEYQATLPISFEPEYL